MTTRAAAFRAWQRSGTRWLAWAVALASLAQAAGCANPDGLNATGQLRDPARLASRTPVAAPDDATFTASWPSQDWWRSFGDRQLDALIAEALTDNPDLEIAQARVQQAAAQAGLADASRQPTLNARTGVSLVRLPASVVGAELGGDFSTSANVLLTGSVPFDLWGGKRAAWESAVNAQRANEVDRQAAQLTLSANVARAYVALGYAMQTMDLARTDRDRTHQLLALTQQRLGAGLDSLTQLRQAESAQASAEQKLEMASMRVDSARLQLATLLGKGPDRADSLQRPTLIAPTQLPLPADLPANLVGRRPDIVAARWRVEASRHASDSARADFYPNFNLGAYAGLAGRGLSSLLSADGLFSLISPAVTLPVFDAGRLRANLAGQQAAQDLAIAQYNKSLIGAFNEVAEQLQVIRSVQRQTGAQQRAIESARQAWQLATARYERGIGTYLETLIVQQTLLTAQADQALLQQQQLDAAITLIRALGGGYQQDSALPPLAGPTPTGRE